MAARIRTAQVAVPLVLALSTAAAAPPQARSHAIGATARRPSITIVTPKAGATIHGSTLLVSVRVRGFKVVNKQFQPPVTGEGHVHFYLDVKNLPTRHVYPSPVHYHSISGMSYTWTGVSRGSHIVAVQLVGNDHVPLHPQAKAEITIMVR